MRSRKPHSKSRNGCDPCKQRRVKCDEQVPACANCTIRKAECHYSNRQALDSQSSSSAKNPQISSSRSLSIDSHTDHRSWDTWSPPSQPTSGTSPSVDGSQSHTPIVYDRLTELGLMRTWCTKTCYSYVPRTSQRADDWLGIITDYAFKHKFLMDIILALACVQTATEQEDSTTASALINAALQYQSNSLSRARIVLEHVSSDNCDALFAFVLLSIPCSIVSAQMPNTEKAIVQTPTESVLITFKYVHMLRFFMRTKSDLLSTGPFKQVTQANDPTTYTDHDPLMRTHMHRLRRLITSHVSKDDLLGVHLEVYLRAVDVLERFFVTAKERAIAWLSLAGEAFLEQLVDGEDAALLALMHWGVLLDQLDYMWWARFTGKRLVEEISNKISGKHGIEWDDAIRWTRLEVGLDNDDIKCEDAPPEIDSDLTKMYGFDD